MARFAAIDIGSNAMRLRIVDVDLPVEANDNRWLPQLREVLALRAPVRLGREVFLTGSLTSQAISSATEALRGFREAMDSAKVDHYRAVATSAVREANNGSLFVERARREAGVEVEIIEGVEEARLVQLAVRRKLDIDEQRALLLDIGGGSIELTLLDHGELRASQSLPVGTVRLLEAFIDGDGTMTPRHARLIGEYVERMLGKHLQDSAWANPDVLIATGGNIDTLANLCPFPFAGEEAVDLAATRRLVGQLSSMSVSERASTFALRPDRADTIVPAAYILLHVASHFDRSHVVAPGVGLKEGVLGELAERYFAMSNLGGEEEGIRKACIRVGRRYQFDETHGITVARLATQIFDDLADLHQLGARARVLLRASALLHDVGDFVRYEAHHKHSCYIIEHSEIMGITPTERNVVANVARYHRKSFPDPAHSNFRDLNRDDRATVRSLAAILRLADALDREHLSKVVAVSAQVTGGCLRLGVEGDADRELEEWTVARKAGLFRAVFDLDVEVVDAPIARPVSASLPPPPRPIRSSRSPLEG